MSIPTAETTERTEEATASVVETRKVCPRCGYILPLGADTVKDEKNGEHCDVCTPGIE